MNASTFQLFEPHLGAQKHRAVATKIMHQWRIQDFPRESANPQVGAPAYKLIKISPKNTWNQEKFGR